MIHARLSKLLADIRRKLTSQVPDLVQSFRIRSPAYCLFIWYQDLSVDEYAPVVGVTPVELRDACLAEKDLSKIGGDALDAIWRPQQCITGPYPGGAYPTGFCKDVSAESNECYSILCTDDTPADEGPALMPFRSALHQVARELNAFDWSGILPLTDDFVVLATDYIGYWIQEDMLASIPEKQLQMLISRGLLLEDWLRYDPKAEQAKYEAQMAAERKAAQDRVEADLRECKQVHQERVKAGAACPKCGFTYGWNGTECSHCRFRK